MSKNILSSDDLQFLETAALVYPQPVALSCGQILRSRTDATIVDAILKAGEVLTRYIAIAGLASVAHRQDVGEPFFDTAELKGPIAFGSFLAAAQLAASYAGDHPLRSHLRAGFLKKEKSRKAGQITSPSAALTEILQLRNNLGHDLSGLTNVRAKMILKNDQPQRLLIQCMRKLEGLLSLPLFIIEQQRIISGEVVGERLTLMGETSDPRPEEVKLCGFVTCDSDPLIAIGDNAVNLAPFMVWEIAEQTKNYRLYILDSLLDKSVKYKSINVDSIEEPSAFNAISEIFGGGKLELEDVKRADGMNFKVEWRQHRQGLESAKDQLDGRIPWNEYDQETLTWFAGKLNPEQTNSSQTIQEELLDEREFLMQDELAQLQLLFGKEQNIRKMLTRNLMDLRAIKSNDKRWDERLESHQNIIQCLRLAVDFFSRHVSVEDVTIDGFVATTGSADYVAMREAMVNMFLHQDYTDKTAAAQIEIQAENVTFFNPGRSLVKNQALIEGGKSQARNPLIGRALRLVGFAELAGSGLREVQSLWRKSKRRPPKIDSDRKGNTFTLFLDWRIPPDNFNKYWKDKLGVSLSDNEIVILELAAESSGVSLNESASATGLSIEDARYLLERLSRQALIDLRDANYFIKEHLLALMDP